MACMPSVCPFTQLSPLFPSKQNAQVNSLLVNLATVLLQKVKLLVFETANRDDRSATISQLFDERLRNLFRGAGHDACMERA